MTFQDKIKKDLKEVYENDLDRALLCHLLDNQDSRFSSFKTKHAMLASNLSSKKIHNNDYLLLHRSFVDEMIEKYDHDFIYINSPDANNQVYFDFDSFGSVNDFDDKKLTEDLATFRMQLGSFKKELGRIIDLEVKQKMEDDFKQKRHSLEERIAPYVKNLLSKQSFMVEDLFSTHKRNYSPGFIEPK
ncbi:hypothetical protein KKG31_04655 [Patescibacteria group bacterium]|nr:hypothetical protein [Patescibacteria group bacterium]